MPTASTAARVPSQTPAPSTCRASLRMASPFAPSTPTAWPERAGTAARRMAATAAPSQPALRPCGARTIISPTTKATVAIAWSVQASPHAVRVRSASSCAPSQALPPPSDCACTQSRPSSDSTESAAAASATNHTAPSARTATSRCASSRASRRSTPKRKAAAPTIPSSDANQSQRTATPSGPPVRETGWTGGGTSAAAATAAVSGRGAGAAPSPSTTNDQLPSRTWPSAPAVRHRTW